VQTRRIDVMRFKPAITVALLLAAALAFSTIAIPPVSAEWTCDIERDHCMYECALAGPPSPNCQALCRAGYFYCIESGNNEVIK
jgi:hypothetical protein